MNSVAFESKRRQTKQSFFANFAPLSEIKYCPQRRKIQIKLFYGEKFNQRV